MILTGRLILICLPFVFGVQLTAADSEVVAERRCIPLEVFLREGSPRSKEARQFIAETYQARDGVTLIFRDVSSNEEALSRFWKLADQYQVQKPGLPAYLVAGRFTTGWSSEKTPNWLEDSLTVEVFVREGCPRCRAAHPVLFQRLAPGYPGFRFVERDLAKSSDAVRRLQELATNYRVKAASVPAVHLGGRLVVGFSSEETTFREWDRILRNITTPCPPAAPRELPIDRSIGFSLRPAVRPANATAQSSLMLAGFFSQPDLKPPPAETTDPFRTQVDEPLPRRQIPAESEPRDDDVAYADAETDIVTLPLVGEVDWRRWGMPAFTLMVGLIDGFNPCAMWVLLFLLSVLVNLKDRWKILAVAGTFVTISGLAYLMFMAAWLNVFQFVGFLRPAQITLGLLGATIGAIHVKDFFAFKKGISLSIPESAKPGLYARVRRVVMAENLWGAILGASVLAVLVNVVELLCTAGLPAMYTGVLTMQEYPAWTNYAYLALYIGGYMFDDALMVGIVVVTLGRHKLQESGGRVLKLISGVVILVLSGLMIFKPEWLV